jgi:ATP-dependent RNA helicase DDX10/DBP4
MSGAGITGRTRPTKVKKQASAAKRKRDDVDVEKLEAAVMALVRHDLEVDTARTMANRT